MDQVINRIKWCWPKSVLTLGLQTETSTTEAPKRLKWFHEAASQGMLK